MSGPLSEADTGRGEHATSSADASAIELFAGRTARVGTGTVQRALPLRRHRTVGPWCFLDHFGPEPVTPESAMRVGPHPHIGLQTVTWLLEGEVVHTDSLGSEQPIRPGQLNLMSAGRGVAHAEDGRGRQAETMHGVQLWVAQPEHTRFGEPAFEHHAELPGVERGGVFGRVLVGTFDGARSTARTDSPIVGVDLTVTATSELPVDPHFEHALVVLSGRLELDGQPVGPDELAYLGPGRHAVTLTSRTPTRALLLGGPPFPDTILMWWNFVARTRDEVDEAYRDWQDRSARFGEVASTLPPMPVPRPT